jgi:hypothetical protein
VKQFQEYVIEESEQKHKNPYKIKDKRVIMELLKKDITPQIKETLQKVLSHIVDELEKGI